MSFADLVIGPQYVPDASRVLVLFFVNYAANAYLFLGTLR